MLVKRFIRRLRSEERGAALVEFALVVPLLMAMLCVIIDFGLALYTLNNVTSAVREGARFGAVRATVTAAAADSIRDRVISYMSTYGGRAVVRDSIGVTEVVDPAGSTVRNVRVELRNYEYRLMTPLAPLVGLRTLKFTRAAIYRLEFQ